MLSTFPKFIHFGILLISDFQEIEYNYFLLKKKSEKIDAFIGVILQLLISIRHRRSASTFASTSGSLDIINDVHSWGEIEGLRGVRGVAVAQRCRVERGPINQPQISMHGTFS